MALSGPSQKPQNEEAMGLCPACRMVLGEAKPVELARASKGQVWHAVCPSCFSQSVQVFVKQEAMTSTVSFLTDLTAEDSQRLWQGTALNADDLIAIHQAVSALGVTKRLSLRHGKITTK